MSDNVDAIIYVPIAIVIGLVLGWIVGGIITRRDKRKRVLSPGEWFASAVVHDYPPYSDKDIVRALDDYASGCEVTFNSYRDIVRRACKHLGVPRGINKIGRG